MTERYKVVLRDPEEAIDRVLVGLREVEAPLGIEGRVMEALEARVVGQGAATFGEKTWRGLVGQQFAGRWATLPGMGGGRLAFGLVLLGMVVAGGVVSISHKVRHGLRGGAVVSRAGARGSSTSRGSRENGRVGWVDKTVAGGRSVPGSGEAVLADGRVASSTFRRERVPANNEVARKIASVAGWGDGVRGDGVGRGDSVGRSGYVRGLRVGDEKASAAVSFPAPPLPLTEQERLLLRVVHQGDTEELAVLNPAVRRARDAEDAAAFAEFFRPPEPLAANTKPRE